MGHNIDSTHHRFYVYRVTNPGPDNEIAYLSVAGGWSALLEEAVLWSSDQIATRKATECAIISKSAAHEYTNGVYFNVARATVCIDPQHPVTTVEGVRCPSFAG